MWSKKKNRKNEALNSPEFSEMPLVAHLVELRNRILKSLAVVVVFLLAASPFASDIYHIFAAPLLAKMPAGTSMIATDVASPFFTPFKLTLVLAIFIALPYLFYQAWAFIAPGLYRHEKKLIIPLLISSTILFYCGAAFAYYVVFPVVFEFFTTAAPAGVAVMTDISKYLDFILTMFLAFGFAFEVPVLIVVLVRSGIVSPEDLAAKRSYIIVAAFVFGMLLTPPDVISQFMLAVPMILLFEAGLITARIIGRGQTSESDEPTTDEATEQNIATRNIHESGSSLKDYYPPMSDHDPEKDADAEFMREFEDAQRQENDLNDPRDQSK